MIVPANSDKVPSIKTALPRFMTRSQCCSPSSHMQSPARPCIQAPFGVDGDKLLADVLRPDEDLA